MFMCCSRASERCSSRPRGVTFSTTGRSPSEGCAARKTRPAAPRPSSASSRKPASDLPHPREDDAGRGRFHEALAIQEHRQLVAPSREPPRDLGRVDLQPGLLAEADLLVDQPDRRLVAELGMAGQDLLGQGTLAPTPGGHHLLDLLRRERAGPDQGRTGRSIDRARRGRARPSGGSSGSVDIPASSPRRRSTRRRSLLARRPAASPGRRGCGARSTRAARSARAISASGTPCPFSSRISRCAGRAEIHQRLPQLVGLGDLAGPRLAGRRLRAALVLVQRLLVLQGRAIPPAVIDEMVVRHPREEGPQVRPGR